MHPFEQRRAASFRPPPLSPGPGAGLVAKAEELWGVFRTPARRAVKALDGIAVVAWALLAIMLLALTFGPTLGAFEISQGTSKPPAVHPVPAQTSSWQPRPSPSP